MARRMEYECILLLLSVTQIFAGIQINSGTTRINGGNVRNTLGGAEVAELRKMLRTSELQNKRLEQQNLRLKLVWAGLQQMCSAINMAPCDCPVDQLSGTTTTPVPQKGVPTPLRVKSIRSDGAIGDAVPLTVSYTAPEAHTTEWLVLRSNGGMMRTSGTRQQYVDTSGEPRFTSGLTIDNVANLTNQVLFRMYSEEQSASLRFNLSSIGEKGENILSEPNTKTLKLNSTYEAPLDTDLNITLILSGQPRQNEYALSGEAFLTSLNTTSYPPAIFEIHAYNGDEINLSLSPAGANSTAMVITVKYPYVQYGGILTVRQLQNAGGFIESFSYGTSVRILSPVTKEVVPFNSVGVYPLPRYTNVFPPSQSIICAAMGNPRPDVYILRASPAGVPTEIGAETVVSDSVTNMKVFNIRADNPAAMGRYVCRAVSGNKTVDSLTEARLLTGAVFDNDHTGIMRNTSNEVIVSCQASGVPRPRLGLRLYYNFGPDITTSGTYNVARIEPNETTSRVMLVLRPSDIAIHTLYCVATQDRMSGEKTRKITVFPESTREDNWQLFDRLQQLERSRSKTQK